MLTKICKKCGITKELSLFQKRKDSKDGYRNMCLICANKEAKLRPSYTYEKRKEYRERYTENHEKEIKERAKVKRQAEKYKEYHRDYARKKYQDNIEEGRKLGLLAAKRRNENNYDYYKEYRYKRYLEIKDTQKYKLLKKISEGKRRNKKRDSNLTINQVNKLIRDSDNKCFWCDCNIPEGHLHLDHIYPLSKGGEHEIYNLVVSCKQCNLKKYTKDPEDWLDYILNSQEPKCITSQSR